jgi:hypothetical protein
MKNSQNQEETPKSFNKIIAIIIGAIVFIMYFFSSYLLHLLDFFLSFLFPFG